MTLKEKVFRNTIIYPAIFAVITLFVLCAYQVMNLFTIGRDNRNRNSVVSMNYKDVRDRSCSFAAMLASYSDIQQGTADDRRHFVTRVVDPIFENINASIVTVHEKDGYVIARGHNPDKFGDDESSMPYVIKAIQGEQSSQTITEIEGIPSLICTKPVYYNEAVSGAVTVGYFLDDAFASHLADLVSGEIIIARNGKVIASSADYAKEGDQKALENKKPAEISYPEMAPELKKLVMKRRKYDLSYVELQKEGKSETGLFIAVDNSRVRRLLWAMMAFCISAIVFVFVAMSSRLNRFCDDLVKPVIETAEHADTVAGGNLDIEPLGSADVRELAQLRESFNKMVDNLRDMYERDSNQRKYLENQVQDLLKGIDAAASGDFSTRFDAERDDAFGDIGRALNKMIEDLQALMAKDHDRRIYLEKKIAELLDIIEATSKGDFSKVYQGDSSDEIGRLGVALSNMTADLKSLMDDTNSRRIALEEQIAELVTVIGAASEGDYSKRVDTGQEGEMGRVGNALNQMISELENRLQEIERMKQLDRDKNEQLESQVREILEVVSRASGGDLTVQLQVYSSKNETEIIARLKENLNNMFSHLAVLVSKVRESSEAVEKISREVSSYTNRLREGARSQAETINRTATFVDSMSDSMDIVTRHSDDVLKLSQKTNEEAAQGGETVSRTVYGIGQVGEAMDDIEVVMKELESSAGEIDAIVRVIDEISDQTNLLALNAAIEAARAGEYGRGFSVVAREVSILAQKSVESTREITLIVRRIQERMKNAAMSTDRGKKRVDEGAALADQAGKALEVIVGSIDNVTGLIKETASSIRERQGETSEIRTSMKEVLGISEESAALALKTSEAVENLARLSRELDSLVRQIRIDKSGS